MSYRQQDDEQLVYALACFAPHDLRVDDALTRYLAHLPDDERRQRFDQLTKAIAERRRTSGRY